MNNMTQVRPGAPKRGRRKKKTRPEKVIAVTLSCIAGVLVLAAIAGFIFLRYTRSLHEGMFQKRDSDQMQQIKAQREEKTLEDTEADWIDSEGNAYKFRDDVISVLMSGIDYMYDERYWDEDVLYNGGNSDVIALAVLDSKTDKLTMLHIPRDTITDVSMVDKDGNYKGSIKINISMAHSYGDGGPLSSELMVDAVSNLLYGVPVYRYAELKYDGLPILNQALGGIEIKLDRDYTDIDKSFKKGETIKLSDEQLIKLIRYRDKSEAEGASKRSYRDIVVLKAMFDQFKSQFKKNPALIIYLYNTLGGYTSTNLSLDEISYYAQKVVDIGFDMDSVVSMQGSTNMGERYAEFHPDEKWLHDFVAETFCIPLDQADK